MGKNVFLTIGKEEGEVEEDQQFVADDRSLLLDASWREDDSWCGALSRE